MLSIPIEHEIRQKIFPCDVRKFERFLIHKNKADFYQIKNISMKNLRQLRLKL